MHLPISCVVFTPHSFPFHLFPFPLSASPIESESLNLKMKMRKKIILYPIFTLCSIFYRYPPAHLIYLLSILIRWSLCVFVSNDYYFASINSRECETCEARCLFCIFNLPPPPPPLPLCPIWPVSERKRQRKSTVCLIPSPEEMCVFFFHQTVESISLLQKCKEAHT